MSVKQLREYFHVGDRPIKPLQPGPAIFVDSKWKMLAGNGLTKTYTFKKQELRNEFVMHCLALETSRRKEDIVWTIKGNSVEIFLKTPNIGLTEYITEFAKTIDAIKNDLELQSIQDEKELFAF